MDYSVTMGSAYDRINAGDIEGFGALLADDFVEHEETPGFPPTKEGVLEFFRAYRAAFPDLRMDADWRHFLADMINLPGFPGPRSRFPRIPRAAHNRRKNAAFPGCTRPPPIQE